MSRIEVRNPYNLEVIETLSLHSPQEAFEMLSRAQQQYLDRSSWLSKSQRVEILEKTISILSARREQLIQDALLEGGKPYQDSAVEIDRGLNGIRIAIDEMHRMTGSEIPMDLNPSSENRIAYTHYQPRGVVFSISAFNHPFNLIVHQVIPAIAVGCPVIIKPSTKTPRSALHLVNALYEAGLPRAYCQLLLCDNELAQTLASDQKVSFLSFVGSAKIGWMLRSQLAPGAHCALEHGGVAPAIIDKTADLEGCVPSIVKSSYYHAGQVCVSTQRIYVHEEIKNEFIQSFQQQVKSLRVGNPADKKTDVGPLISPAEVDRVHSWVQEAKVAGAQLLYGGEKLSETLYAPTIILEPSEDVQLSKQEVFGPVVSLYSFNDLEEAIMRANQVAYAFQASIFTNQLDRALRAASRLEGSAIMINDHTAFRVDWMPFGGYKHSGLGVGGIGYTMRDMAIEKLVVIKHTGL